MAATVEEVLHTMEQLAPPELACKWDNVGLLVDAGTPVTGIMTALDITKEVIEEAKSNGCELIVSHHPVIFQPLKRISSRDIPAILLQYGISAICMHTNLDSADGGVNDTLAAMLEMTDCTSFSEGCGRIGRVTPVTAAKLAQRCSSLLQHNVKYVEADHLITCLAEVSGAGGSELEEAITLGADCLVTGEANHHQALLAKEKGVGLVAAGHWGTEHHIAAVLAQKLHIAYPGLRVMQAKNDRDPFTYL